MSEFRRNMVIAFVAVFFFAPPLWMLFDRDPVYTFEEVTIEPHEARAGQDIFVNFKVKPLRAPCAPGVVYRELKEIPSGKLHVFDPILRRTYPEMEDNRFARIIRLPANITPGPVIYRGAVCYTCNPMQAWLRWPVCISTPEVEFRVVK